VGFGKIDSPSQHRIVYEVLKNEHLIKGVKESRDNDTFPKIPLTSGLNFFIFTPEYDP
jgi:hypothetical protein